MGKSSSITIGYKFYLTLHMGLSTAVDSIKQIVAGGKQVYTGDITDSGDIAIDKPELFGGDQKEGGIVGTLSVMMGDADQQPHPLLVRLLGTPMPAFRGLATVLFDGEVSSMTQYIKAWSFQVQRFVKGWRTPVWEAALCQIDQGMNPAHILYRAITDPVTGLGRDPSSLDLVRLKAAAQTLHDEGMGLCLKWSRSDVLSNFISMVTSHVGGLWVDDPTTGKQYLRLLRGDYDIDTLPLLDESNIVELSSYDQSALAGAVNQVTVTYHDCSTNKDVAVTVQNPAAILAQGHTVTQSTQYPGFWSGDQATRAAMRDLRGPSSLPGRAKVKTQSSLEVTVGDVVAFSWARLNLSRVPMRVLEVDRGSVGDNAITLTLSQDIYSMPDQSYVVVQPPLWTAPDLTPEPVAHQQLVEASYRDLVANLSKADMAQVDADAGYVGTLAVRPTSTAINYALWSRTGTADFAQHGTGDFAPSAVLGTSMPAEVGPTTVPLTADIDLDQVQLGTEVLIESELCRLTALDIANLTMTVARGCVDTVPAAHAAGARAWFTDQFTGVDKTEYIAGETADVKLLTIAGAGTLDASLAPIGSLQLHGRQILPYAPGLLTVAGTAYPADVTVDMPVTWAHRDRLLQADQLVDTTQASIGPEPGTTYNLRVYADDVLQATHTGITSASFTPDRLGADGVVRIEVEAERDGHVSLQSLAATFDYHWLMTMSQTVFGHGDGSADAFQLVDDAGQAITSDITVESVYRTDWQGRQLLYRTARTNYAHPSEPTLATLSARSGSPAPLDDTIPTSSASFTPDGIQFPANPTSQQSAYVASSISHADVAVGQPLYFSLLVKSTSSTPPTLGFSLNLVAFQRQALPDSVNVVQAGPNCWYYTCVAHVINPPNASDTCGVARPIADPTPGETYTISALSLSADASDAGAYIRTTTDARTVTGYTLSTSGMATMGEPPVQDAVLDWSGTGR